MDELTKARENVNKDPNNTELLNNLAKILFEVKNYEELREVANKVLTIDKENYIALSNLSLYYLVKGQYQQAETYLTRSIQINDTYSYNWSRLGIVEMYKKNWKKAIEYIERAIKLNPDFNDGYGNIGYAYHLLNRYEKSVEYCQQQLKFIPDDTKALKTLILSMINTNDYNTAVDIFFQNYERISKTSDILQDFAYHLTRRSYNEDELNYIYLQIEKQVKETKNNLLIIEYFIEIFQGMKYIDFALNLVNLLLTYDNISFLWKFRRIYLKTLLNKHETNDINELRDLFSQLQNQISDPSPNTNAEDDEFRQFKERFTQEFINDDMIKDLYSSYKKLNKPDESNKEYLEVMKNIISIIKAIGFKDSEVLINEIYNFLITRESDQFFVNTAVALANVIGVNNIEYCINLYEKILLFDTKNYEAKAGINKINSTNTIENSYIISNLFFTTIETRRLIIDLFDEKIINFRRYDELEELHEETINNIKSNITIFHQFIENSLNDLTNYYNNKVEDKDEYRDGEERSILRDNLYNRMIKIIKIFPERFVLDKLSNMNHYYILERICEERHAEWLNEKINVDLDYGYNRWYFNLLGKIGNADSASLCYKFISTNIDTILQNEVIENDNNDFYNCLITTIESFGLLVDKFNLSRDTQYTNLIEKIVFNPKYTERIRVAAMDYILLNNLTSYQDKIVLLLNEKLPERDSWDNSIAGWINHGYIKNVPQKAREILASFGIPEHVNYIYQILLQEKIPDSFHVIIMNILKANRIASQFTNTLCELIITGKKENHKKIFDYIAMRYQNRTHTLTVWDKNLTLYQLKMINSLKMDLSIAEVSSINTFSLSIHRDIYQDILEIRNEIDNFSLTYLPNVEPIASGEYKEVFNKIKTICKKISE